jgi:hypothetical protein
LPTALPDTMKSICQWKVLCSSLTFVGDTPASTLEGGGLTSEESTLWPRKSIEETSKTYFSVLMARTCSHGRLKIWRRCSL